MHNPLAYDSAQTIFANSLLRVFQQQGKTIVYENQEQEKRYLLPPNGKIYRGDLTDSPRPFKAELDDDATVYICDCHKQNIQPERSGGYTIVLSSPDVKHYDSWISGGRMVPILYLPLWSRDELNAVVPAIYQPRSTAKRDSNGDVVKDAAGGVWHVVEKPLVAGTKVIGRVG